MSERARVLLVDDNEAMLARATKALTPECVVVGAVRDGRAALDAAGKLRPDVIVLDISMLHRAVLSHDDFRNDTINTRWLETTLLPALLSTLIAPR